MKRLIVVLLGCALLSGGWTVVSPPPGAAVPPPVYAATAAPTPPGGVQVAIAVGGAHIDALFEAGTLRVDDSAGVYLEGRFSGSVHVPPAATPAVTHVAGDSGLATCERIVGDLCRMRNGVPLTAATVTREELGYWWAQLDIDARYLADAYHIAQCESNGQWTRFYEDRLGNREVGPFAIVWRFHAAGAAEQYGRPLDWTDRADYMRMLAYILQRNGGWHTFGCAQLEPTRPQGSAGRAPTVPAVTEPAALPPAAAPTRPADACDLVSDTCVDDSYNKNTLPGQPHALQNYVDGSGCDRIAPNSSGDGFQCVSWRGQTLPDGSLTIEHVQTLTPAQDGRFISYMTCLLQASRPVNWISASAQEFGALAVRIEYINPDSPFTAYDNVQAAWRQYQAGAAYYWPWSACSAG